MIAESGRRRDLNRAAGGDFDRRIDDVFFPITFAGGDIAGERVAGKGRDRDVVCPADAALEHATAPCGYVAREAQRLDFFRARMAADAAQLYVDDARGIEFYGGFRVADVMNRFVETNRSLQLPLELCVIGNIVPPEWLLHHQQAKFVEALEVLQVSQGVG